MGYPPLKPEPTEVSEHYVARLVLEKVERTKDPNTREGKRDRVVDEVTSISLKEKNLRVLITKLGLHLEIVTRFPEESLDDSDKEI